MSNTVSLAKGGVVNLSKKAPGLNNVMVGLGWDPVKHGSSAPKKGFFSRLFGGRDEVVEDNGYEIDCDAYAIMLADNKLKEHHDIIYFGHKKHESGAITHCGDNLTGQDIEGQADDEQILISLNKVPSRLNQIVLGVNIYQAKQRNQSFGKIRNAYIRLVNQDNGEELCRYAISDSTEYDKCTNVIMGTLSLVNGQWEFKADGEGSVVRDIGEVADRYN